MARQIRPLDVTCVFATAGEFQLLMKLAAERIEGFRVQAQKDAGGMFPISSEEAATMANGEAVIALVGKQLRY